MDNRDGYFSKEELEMLSNKYSEWSKMAQEKLNGKNQGKSIESMKKHKKIRYFSIRNEICMGSCNRWKEGELIGHGSFGRVISALNLRTGEIMAVKQVHIENMQSSAAKEVFSLMNSFALTHCIIYQRIKALELEIELLSNLNNKNIVRYIGTARTKTTLNIFLEYVSGRTLLA